MKLIVGLGNPGRGYERTRHNAGFLLADRLAARHGLSFARSRFRGEAAEGRVGQERGLLLKPLTYMNRSGQAVGEAAAFFKLDPADLLILVDDASLELGRVRLRAAGSPGGHNGLADIERALSTRSYPRLRFGIDPPPDRVPQRDYVLGRFSPDQCKQLDPALDRGCEAVEAWVKEGIEQAMTLYNRSE